MIDRNLSVVAMHIENEARDPALVMDLYTDDVVQEFPTRGLVFDNKADIEANYRRTFAAMADVRLEPLERFATEDRVVDDMIVRCRIEAEGLENCPLPVGSDVELRLFHVFHMRGGLIAREIVHEVWTAI